MIKSYKKILCFLYLIISFSVTSQKWDQNFIGASATGFSGRDIIEFNGDLYVGGAWNAALQTFIMKWDGTDWSAVGTGFVENTDTNAGIYALEIFNGELYAAGSFDISISSTTYKGIVKWNGTTWEAITDFPNAGFVFVYDLVDWNGNIMIGGNFSGVFGGSTTIENIIGHNGTNWVAFDEGVRNGEVRTMEVHNGDLYIAGKFINNVSDNAVLDNFAVWDGINQEWDNVGAFASLYTNNGYIDKIKSFGSNLYAYSIRDDIFNTNPQLLKWDLASTITNINIVSVTPDFSRLASLSDMIVYNGNLVVSGNYLDSQVFGNSSPVQIETYDGTTWNKELPGGASASALGVFGGKLTTGVYVMNDPSATIEANKTVACENDQVTFSFTEVSSNPITAVNWTFEGGAPATSSAISPVVTYANGGDFDVTLEVTSSDGTNEVIAQNFIHVNNDLTITSQPVDVSICDTENAVFSVGASGSGVLIAYQWQMDDNSGSGFVDLDDGVVLGVAGASNISGSQSSTMTISGNGLSQNNLNGNKFRCVVSKCTTINTDEVVLTVTEAPVLTESANHAAICVSGDATISLTATSPGTLSYQWQYRIAGTSSYSDLSDTGPYSGTATSDLTITGVDNTLPELFDSDNSDGLTSAHFRCIISADGCTINSNLSILTIHGAPSITDEPDDVTVCNLGSGVTTAFSVNSSLNNLAGLNYQWQVDDGSGFVNLANDAIYGGVNTKTLELTSAPSTFNGNKYRCEIGGCSSPVYSADALLTIDDAPVIIQQPVTASICEGSDTQFTVEATGSNLSYQWQERIGSTFVDITNNATYFANDGTLQISSASSSLHNRSFRCIVSSGSCSVNSGAPQLRVYAEPAISGGPVDRTACDGESSVTFTESASNFNSAAHTYQWQEAFAGSGIFVDITDDTKFSGINGTSLTVLTPTFSMNGNQYRLTVKGCASEIASDPATLTVNQQPVFSASPLPQTVCAGEQVTFKASAIGTGVTYAWERDTGDGVFSAVTGFSSDPDFTFIADASQDGYKYKVVAKSASPCVGEVESFEATLTVNETEITGESNTASLCRGETAMFTVVATGESLTYQWLENNSPIVDGGIYSGGTTGVLTITDVSVSLSGSTYRCEVTGACGTAFSTSFSMTVNGVEKPVITFDGNSLLTVNNVTGDAYEWFLDGNLVSTDVQFSPSEEGSYTVIVYSNGCASELSDVFEYTESALGIGDEYAIHVFPNPAQQYLKVRTEKALTLQLFSLDGKRALITEVKDQQPIDLSSIGRGHYIIRLLDRNSLVYSGKVLKIN